MGAGAGSPVGAGTTGAGLFGVGSGDVGGCGVGCAGTAGGWVCSTGGATLGVTITTVPSVKSPPGTKIELVLKS